jgi:predicted AlkP superfamily phosphohydrolase/phosphomutase
VIAVVQFDAASVERLERLLGEGRLPTLHRLRERGTWTPLETPATHFPASCYPTLYSGLPVGQHGFYYPFMWKADEQRVRFTDALPHPESVWDRIGRHGKRALLIDAYEAPPPTALDGVWLSGWQLVNRIVLPPRSRPKALRRRLTRELGRAPTLDEVFGRPSADSLLRIRRRLIPAPGRASAAATWLLARERFDLLWLAFPSVHLAGHQLWDSSQLANGALDPNHRELLEGALDEVYVAADAALGRIVDALPEDVDMMVLSPLGMTTCRGMPDLMEALVAAVMDLGREQGDGHAAWRLRGAVPSGLRAAIARALPAPLVVALTARLESPALDWGRARAFAVPSDVQGYVRLNLRGRERDGIVDPRDADAVLTELAEGLLSFRDEAGEPIIDAVERVSDVVDAGACRHQLPDLIVQWTRHANAAVRRVRSERYGDVQRQGVGSGRSGNHDASAWALLVPGRSRPVLADRPANLIDIAPTVCSLLGVDGGDLPGTPLLVPA